MSLDEQGNQNRLDLSTPAAAGALALSAAMLGGGVLWYRFGESIYVEQLLSAIVNCF